MARTGKALNLWLPDEVMAALDTFAQQQGMTKTQAVIRAIALLQEQQQVSAQEVQITIAELQDRLGKVETRLAQLEQKKKKK
uniref:CopG domain protein DNA-binding domain protein n=1 Tax=Cyanothece sp. (strain PCC 7425 / ATCC 29141) TaxID=395961 RepID=B8HPQ4_CYAP4